MDHKKVKQRQIFHLTDQFLSGDFSCSMAHDAILLKETTSLYIITFFCNETTAL